MTGVQGMIGSRMMALTAMLLSVVFGGVARTTAWGQTADEPADWTQFCKSIRDFGVLPDGDPVVNRDKLQAAIEWAAPRGAALFVPPNSQPYPVAGGLILRRNVSLVGVHGPVGRGTRHPDRPQPVGSVFAIQDEEHPFITVEGATQLSGLQFWYPRQTLTDPLKIIEYPPTIRVSDSAPAHGVTLSRLTFFGEFNAMDFRATQRMICEQILIEHCYGYPLSGQFIAIDYCRHTRRSFAAGRQARLVQQFL